MPSVVMPGPTQLARTPNRPSSAAKTARSNLRFQDRRIADLEARISEPVNAIRPRLRYGHRRTPHRQVRPGNRQPGLLSDSRMSVLGDSECQ
jgi:hypothetical protein